MGNYINTLMIYGQYNDDLDKILSNITGWEYKVEEGPIESFSLKNFEKDIQVFFGSRDKVHDVLLISHIKAKYKGGNIYDITYEDNGQCKMEAYDKILNELCREINKTIKKCRDNNEVSGDIYCAVCPSQFKMKTVDFD